MTTLQTLRSQHGDGLRVLMEMHTASLNVLVAENVMGYTWGPSPDPEADYECWRAPRREDPHLLCEVGPFSPAEEIADCWSVVERMREKGYEFEIMSQPGRKTYCRFWKGEYESGPLIECTAIRETLCRAVAECSLLAVAGEQP